MFETGLILSGTGLILSGTDRLLHDGNNRFGEVDKG